MSVFLPDGLRAEIERVADKLGMSMSDVMRAALTIGVGEVETRLLGSSAGADTGAER